MAYYFIATARTSSYLEKCIKSVMEEDVQEEADEPEAS